MKILAIESSCDETAAAIVEPSADKQSVRLLSHSLATSLAQHAQTGGIIPENAARAQIQYIIPVIYEALEKAGISWDRQTAPNIDAIAVTYGPGLIGSLLVGVETAKTLSYLWDKPLIPTNHLFGHMYANWIQTHDNFAPPVLPAIVLIVSGNHTDLLLMKSHEDITWLGGTRDDAAGEAFDKIGRLLGFSYPAGPLIEEAAKKGDPQAHHFPRPLIGDKAFDFSFSGLKTAVLREVKDKILSQEEINNLSRAAQDAIIDVLVKKTITAAKQFGVTTIILSGGVAANGTLVQTFKTTLERNNKQQVNCYVPPRYLCTDNAAMIGAAACFRKQIIPWQNTVANPQLYFD